MHRGLPAFDRPEILEAELSGLVLEWPRGEPLRPRFRSRIEPPSGALAAARSLLEALGALDREGRITADGREMARIGAHPRLAAMMLAAGTAEQRALAADLAALLEERDPLRAQEAPADIGLRLAAIWPMGRHSMGQGSVGSRQAGMAPMWPSMAMRCTRPTAGVEPHPPRRRAVSPSHAGPVGREPAAIRGRCSPPRFQTASRSGAANRARSGCPVAAARDCRSPIRSSKAGLLVAASLELKASSRIRLAAPLDPDALPHSLAGRVTEQVESRLRSGERDGGGAPAAASGCAGPVRSYRTGRSGAGRGVAGQCRRRQDLRPLPWTDASRQLQLRVALMRGIEPDAGWPDLGDPALKTTVQDWLVPHLTAITRFTDLEKLDLHAILRGLLSWDLASRLDRDLPTHLSLPGGRAAIDYTEAPPLASARAQASMAWRRPPCWPAAAFRCGWHCCPRRDGRSPSPPTSEGFWKGAWADATARHARPLSRSTVGPKTARIPAEN